MNFEDPKDIITGSRRQQHFEALNTRHAAALGDEYVLVLLMHQGVFRDTYYLNLRPEEDDDVYSKHIGLFGGKVDKDGSGDPTETQERTAEREILEETGLEIGHDFYYVADLTGYNNAKKKTAGTIFLKILRKTVTKKIKSHLETENPRLIAINRKPIGKVIVIRRYFGKFSFFWRWWKLTPQAAYALRDIFDRDPTK